MKRVLLIVTLLALTALAFVWRIRVYKNVQAQEVVSLASEWRTHGKPVHVFRARQGAVHFYTKVRMEIKSKRSSFSWVTRDTAERLRAGQRFYTKGPHPACTGRVVSVSLSPDRLTGMYYVNFAIDQEADFSGQKRVLAYVDTSSKKGVLFVPNAAVFMVKNRPYVWVAQEGTAVQRPVVLGEENCDTTVVVQGLDEGEAVIVGGMSVLEEGDLVRIQGKGHRAKRHS